MPQQEQQLLEEQSYSLSDWRKGYESQYNESEYLIDHIEGEIPSELSGTLYRNGPGLLDVHGTPLQHPFDGDGMICAFTFSDGKCHFRNSFVKTKEYLEEQKAGKMLYRGVFGSQKPGGFLANLFDLKIKNIANTNVIHWGDKLLALWEAAKPHHLNPDTLETIGIDNLDGVLDEGESFSAHPKIDPHSQFNHDQPSLVNFGIKTGLSSTINLYEFDESGKIIEKYNHIIPGFSFIHDFVITPNYCIFFQNPTTFNPLPFLFGLRGAGECVNFQGDKPTKIILIPRQQSGQEAIILDVEAGFIFHHANAFEVNEQEIVVDSICYDELTQIEPDTSFLEVNFESLAPGQLWRFKLNLATKKVTKELIDERCVEFPTINPSKVGEDYRYVFIGATHGNIANAPLQALLKLDLVKCEQQLYSFAPKGFAGEPVFVPKAQPKSEDDGWILDLIYDSEHHRSDLIIFDGLDISQPVATLHLRQHIPYGLHGSWKGN